MRTNLPPILYFPAPPGIVFAVVVGVFLCPEAGHRNGKWKMQSGKCKVMDPFAFCTLHFAF